MPKFEYTAIDKENKKVSGILESSSIAVATQTLKHRALKPISVKPLKEGAGGVLATLGLGRKNKKIKIRDMVVFTRQLSTMINAGVPLVRSLATLQGQTENISLRRHIGEIKKDVEGGSAFADALGKHPGVFSPIYINMVRAGETGGILDDILKKLATQQEKDAKIRGKFKGALTYPAILLFITLSVFLVLMIFVMPRIGTIIKDLSGPDAEMPQLTQVMLSISSFIITKWYILLIAVVVGVYFLKKYVQTPAGRLNKDTLLLRIPIINTIVTKVAIARFARIFASLLSAGVAVVDCINVTAKAIGNAVIENELAEASKAVTNGQQLSEPLSTSKVFPPIVSQMMSVGEETGKTDEILIKVADFYEEEVDVMVESISSILEPIMIVVMGTMVGLIAASVIGPISNLSSQI